MAAAGIVLVGWSGLLGPFLLGLEYPVFFRSFVLGSHLVILALHVLCDCLDWYVVDIVPADLREAAFFEPFGAEPGFRAVVLPHFGRTGVGEGDVGRLAGDCIGVFELYLFGRTGEDCGLIGPEADPFSGRRLTKLLVKVKVLLLVAMLAEIGLADAAV